MKNNIPALTAASYLSMLFLGVASGLIGAAARNIGLTPFQIGLYLTVQNVGFMIAVVVSGALADTVEKPRILLTGSLILALSFFTFYLTGNIWLNLAIMVLIGIGVGTYEGVTDAMLLEIHERRQSLHININHFFVTVGSILITIYLIFLEMNWRVSLVQSAIVVMILAIFYAAARLTSQSKQAEDYLQRIRILSRERFVLVLFVAAAIVVGVEIGTIGILTTYLMELREFSQATSKVGLVLFLLGIASGRVLVGFFSKDEQAFRAIMALFGLSTLTYIFMFSVDLGQLSYVLVFFAGLSISAALPLIITLAGQSYPEMTGTVIGSIKVAIPVGGILLPFIMSLAADRTSLQLALFVFPAALLLAFGLLLLAFRRQPSGGW